MSKINKIGKIMLYVSPKIGTTLASPITPIKEVFLSLIICKKLYPNGVDTREQFLLYNIKITLRKTLMKQHLFVYSNKAHKNLRILI